MWAVQIASKQNMLVESWKLSEIGVPVPYEGFASGVQRTCFAVLVCAGVSAECPTIALPLATTDRTGGQLLQRSGLLLDNLQMYPPHTSTGQGSQRHSVRNAQSCGTIL